MVTAYQAQDTRDLLDHIAWTDIIAPALEKEIAREQAMLVQAVLLVEPTVKDGNGQFHTITKEKIAGKIHGLMFAKKLIEDILVKGEKAVLDLSKEGINL